MQNVSMLRQEGQECQRLLGLLEGQWKEDGAKRPILVV